MQTPEQKAQTSRENGAKSHGPTSEAGKEASSRNAIKHGQYADVHEIFVPPDGATFCNEDRQDYVQLVKRLVLQYLPKNDLAKGVVREIAIANWQTRRLHRQIAMVWNLAMVETAKTDCTVVPELAEMQSIVQAVTQVYTAKSPILRMQREIRSLGAYIRQLERRLIEVHRYFPTQLPAAEKGTQPPVPVEPAQQPAQPVETKPVDPAPPPADPQPVFVTEDNPLVRAGYQKDCPGRPIVVLGPDNVALGIEEVDNLPIAPRKAA